MEGFNLKGGGWEDRVEVGRNIDNQLTAPYKHSHACILSSCSWSHLLSLIKEVPHSQQACQEVLKGGTTSKLNDSTLDIHHRISELLGGRGGGVTRCAGLWLG